MDGYVLSSSKTTGASPSNPLTFQVSGSIAAGDSPLTLTDDDQDEMKCYEIMTGAPFPLSNGMAYDACIRHEAVTYACQDHDQSQDGVQAGPSTSNTSFPRAKRITLNAPVPPRSNRKLAGEDFRTGDLLAKQGTVVTPGIVMVLSSTGIERVLVRAGDEDEEGKGRRRRLRIGILTTGKEVANNHNLPTGTLRPQSTSVSLDSNTDTQATVAAATTTPSLQKGHIFNSNAPYLVSTLDSWGHEPVVIPAPAQDTPEAFQERLRTALPLDLDLIITTGGVSAGKHDYVPSSVVDLGGRIVFHKTTIRPGFPVMFGEIPSDENETSGVPIFGLPGNPIAVAACLRFLVTALLTRCNAAQAPSLGLKVGRLLSPDFSARRGSSPATAGCGVEKTPQDVTGQKEHRARYHKKPLMTRCFLPSKLHRSRPVDAVSDTDERGATVPGLDMLPWVEPLTRSASLTKAMSEADCWVVLPEGKEVFEPGEIVEVVSMKPE